MRCYICDWSPTADSLFFESLADTELPTMLIDLPNGKSVCNHCHHSSLDDLQVYAFNPPNLYGIDLEPANDNSDSVASPPWGSDPPTELEEVA